MIWLPRPEKCGIAPGISGIGIKKGGITARHSQKAGIFDSKTAEKRILRPVSLITA